MDAVSHDEHPMVQIAGVAQHLPRMRDSAKVELHGVSVDPDRDGSVLDEPLRHLRLVGGDVESTGDGHSSLRLVEVASLVGSVVRVVLLGLQAADCRDGLVRVLRQATVAAVVQLVAVH